MTVSYTHLDVYKRQVLKPAEQTPLGILLLMELIGDLLPPGVLNVVTGFGLEAGKPLASSKRIAKIAFTGETTTGRLIMQYASQNIIPAVSYTHLDVYKRQTSSRAWAPPSSRSRPAWKAARPT